MVRLYKENDSCRLEPGSKLKIKRRRYKNVAADLTSPMHVNRSYISHTNLELKFSSLHRDQPKPHGLRAVTGDI
jgi:hypothetical protein